MSEQPPRAQSPPLIRHVNDPDRAGRTSARRLRDQLPNDPGADDRHIVVGLDTTAVERVHGRRCKVGDHGVIERDAIGYPAAEQTWDDDLFGVDSGSPSHRDNSVAGTKVAGFRTDLADAAGGAVAEWVP